MAAAPHSLGRDPRTLLARSSDDPPSELNDQLQGADAGDDDAAVRAELVFEVKNAKALKSIPYEKQADPTMDAPAVRFARASLRDDARVVATLQGFWEAAMSSLGASMVMEFDRRWPDSGRQP